MHIREFQQRVWSRIRELASTPDSPESVTAAEQNRFASVLRYIFDLRNGQNAARVSATYLGFRVAAPSIHATPTLVELAAAIEIANTSITYIEDKVIDDDRTDQRGREWTHAHYGLGVSTILNSFVHFLSRRTLHNAIRAWTSESAPTRETLDWFLDEFENIFRDANYGQFLDVSYGSQLLRTKLDEPVISLDDPCDYVLSDHINELRTGQFVQRAAEFGAVLGGLAHNSESHRVLRCAMRLAGICVQDLNDLQDFVPAEGFPGSIGKDLLLLKKTFPVIWLIENAPTLPQAEALFSSIQDPTIDRGDLIHRATELLVVHGVFDMAARRIASRLDRATELLASSFPNSANVVEEFFGAMSRRADSVTKQINRRSEAA
jgi:geranylgeranyl pyrophosphate synthase